MRFANVPATTSGPAALSSRCCVSSRGNLAPAALAAITKSRAHSEAKPVRRRRRRAPVGRSDRSADPRDHGRRRSRDEEHEQDKECRVRRLTLIRRIVNLRTIQRSESEASASLPSKKALASALDLDVHDLDYPETRRRVAYSRDCQCCQWNRRGTAIPMAAVSLSEAAIPRGTAPSTTCQVKRSRRSTCAVMALRRTPSCQLADYANAMEDGHEVTTTAGCNIAARGCALILALGTIALAGERPARSGPLFLCQAYYKSRTSAPSIPIRCVRRRNATAPPWTSTSGLKLSGIRLGKTAPPTVRAGGSVPVQTK